MTDARLHRGAIWVTLVLALSYSAWASCPKLPIADVSLATQFAADESLPFQFPLASMDGVIETACAVFCTPASYTVGPKDEIHTAEDYHLSAGTPVYAMADGQVSFSGHMDGYGWLILIDHPQANLYSLYGHLSPSRWHSSRGAITKGELIGYLGDADENGGTADQPLRTHLHFGVRAGQRADYPGKGEWRWQAGWIKPCPTDIGWLHPSGIITGQHIPTGGFPNPQGSLLEIWGSELLFASVYLICGLIALVYATKRDKPIFLVVWGLVLLGVAIVFVSQGMKTGTAVAGMGVVLLFLGGAHFVHRQAKRVTRA